MIPISDANIGGAIVARTFTSNGKQLKRGDNLSAEQVLAMNLPNRRALADSGYLEIYPRPSHGGERFMVGLGKDKGYNVIEGRVINDAPISREEAEELVRA